MEREEPKALDLRRGVRRALLDAEDERTCARFVAWSDGRRGRPSDPTVDDAAIEDLIASGDELDLTPPEERAAS